MFGKNEFARFWNDGYLVGDIGLDNEICSEALDEVKALTFYEIFREVYSKKRDKFRKQADVVTPGTAIQTIESYIQSTILEAMPLWLIAPGSWHALKYLPGGMDQEIHRDFPTFETARAHLNKGIVPASVIVALMNGTQLHVYPGCFGASVEKSKRKTITLNVGELVISRGDLVHAGAKHSSLNIRLHCYIQVKGVKQKANSTEAVVYNTYMCNKCNERMYSRRDLAEHRHGCTEACRYKCPWCPKGYTVENSLHQHLRRHHPKVRQRNARNSAPVDGSEEREEARQAMEEGSSEEREDEEAMSDEESEEEIEEESEEEIEEESDEESEEEIEEESDEESDEYMEE